MAARYAFTLDLPRSMGIYAKRIGLEEVDNMVVALKQSEVTGRLKTILAGQSELLKARRRVDEEKASRNRANFLPLVSKMVAANIMIMVEVSVYSQIRAPVRPLFFGLFATVPVPVAITTDVPEGGL